MVRIQPQAMKEQWFVNSVCVAVEVKLIARTHQRDYPRSVIQWIFL